MSPRAAWRLETLGFAEVYDYAAGKKDWGSWGLPRGGELAAEPSAGELARRDVPTCRLDERLQDVRRRVRDAGWDTCFVVTAERVILGRLGRRALARDDDVAVEEAMTSGPSTVRPSIGAAAAAKRMRGAGVKTLPVSTPDGALVGLLLLEDAEAS